MEKVDSEVRRIIDEQYALARGLIEDNRDKMHVMAKALLEWETIDSEQVDDIMAGRHRARPRTGRRPAFGQRWQPAARRRSIPTRRRPQPEVGLQSSNNGASAPFFMARSPSRHLCGRPRVSASTCRRPRVMGIVNVTPDSFSDGGAMPPPAPR
jgi:hypothetical protein